MPRIISGPRRIISHGVGMDGARLRRERIARKVTQAQLAKLLEVEQSAISMLETGQMRAGPLLAGKISAWLAGSAEGRGAARGPYRKPAPRS